MPPCPCTSGRPYRDCCAPYHRGDAEAPDALALMRSRYAAFALKDGAYLWRTLHEDHESRALARDAFVRSIRGSVVRFMGLSILDQRLSNPSAVSQVLFLAKIFERGRDRSFVELSDFLYDGVGFRYVSGVTIPLGAIAGDPEALRIDTFLSTPALK